MDDLKRAQMIATSGMKVQSHRLRVVSENLANADSLPQMPGEDPYRRKVISFKSELDRASGTQLVQVDKVRGDMSDFTKKFDPRHPAADAEGYVLTPNVNPLIELMDMREAQRTYEANLNVVMTSKALLSRTVEMLR
ncbi:flagellar basal body rod protein FlgC [Telmatospirillum sp. J64-1]|uniref:flagellar basal body rod protein FlgC n=1 Tax=Telmatospirillum sp. J64-1 TaxID=2502183 RepID=UPI00115EA414|nr:flagellar basal body rod protein FlgC [Telmatospirillum sp. J64-1]